jgi:hypothetical protein
MATNTYAEIQSVTLGSSAATIELGSGGTLPQTYTDLRLVITGSTVATAYIGLQFNGAGSGYSCTSMGSSGSSTGSSRGTTAGITFVNDAVAWVSGVIANSSWDIFNYTNSTTHKHMFNRGYRAGDTSLTVGRYHSTSPITSISIVNNGSSFATGTTVTLYGIKADTNAYTAKATGGNVIAADQSYVYHAFTGGGTFTPTTAITADILVVAGGGGGGYSAGASGGGGAGGVLAFASQSLASGTGYTVTVGSGGNGNPATGGDGATGNNSQFGSITPASVGGGGGGSGGPGLTGGSGGGGGYFLNTNNGTGAAGGSATSGQGYAGGTGYAQTNNHAGAGGGGAGGVGGNVTSAGVGGVGGAGATTYTNWGSFADVLRATSLGVNGYLASGGAGGAYYNITSGSNGGGTGGNVTTNSATNGATNTGSGGGGAASGGFSGANGGSGLVIVRYARQ